MIWEKYGLPIACAVLRHFARADDDAVHATRINVPKSTHQIDEFKATHRTDDTVREGVM